MAAIIAIEGETGAIFLNDDMWLTLIAAHDSQPRIRAQDQKTHKRLTAMNVKVHYRITQDRAGLPQDFSGARRFVAGEGQVIEDMAKAQLAADYQIPTSAIEICRIEH
jgi:hypothetical protein